MEINTLVKIFALPVSLWLFVFVHHVSGQTVIVGFVGGSVILPCSLTPSGDLGWKQGLTVILVKQAGGNIIIDTGPYKEDVSLVNNDDLMINLLKRSRDGETRSGDKVFACEYTGGARQVKEEIHLRLIDPVKITGVSISGTSNVRAGISRELTCSVAGDPNPPPSYSWSVDGGSVNKHTSNTYIFIPDKSMKTITCTATNMITDESVFSEEEVTATLDVQYLETPSIPTPSHIIETNTLTLMCLAEGNPQPRFQWRNFSNPISILSHSANYTIENVQRSATGTYRCEARNTIFTKIITTNIIVQYPPDVTASYDKITRTLTCRAEGVPANYAFSPFEHRFNGKPLRSFELLPSGSTATLKLPGTSTYADTGYYVCQVSNGIKSPQREQVFVTPQSPAIFETQTQSLAWKEGDDKSISVPFYTYSDTPNVKVVWKKSGESTVLTSHREETGPVRLMIRGQSVSIEGTVTVLTLRDVTQSDEGNYTVTVTNDINGVFQSNQITFSLFVTILPLSSTDEGESGVNVGAAVGGGIAGLAVIISVILSVLLFRAKRNKPNETIRPPEEQTVSQFQTIRQEGGVYQDLAINPDYMNTTEDQPYATLGEKARDAADYEQCDVPVNETNRDDDKKVPQYEDVSISAQEAIPEYIDVCSNDSENKDYENKVFQEEASKTYYNL